MGVRHFRPLISAFQGGRERIATGIGYCLACRDQHLAENAVEVASGIEMHPKNEDGTRNRAPTASFHSLRHTFVTRLMRRGIAPALIQAAVGHSTMMMTEHYTHISAEDLARGLVEN